MRNEPGVVSRVLGRTDHGPETPVVFCIDIEPDPYVFDRADPPPWLGFERLVQNIPFLRERLSEATRAPATFSWFLRMDPQIAETWGSPAWLADKYGDVLAAFTAEGDELGLHTHAWRWESEIGWVADFEDPAWGEHCLQMALDAFESAFGRACEAHRGGARFLSGAMLSMLEARTVTVDLTVEPGLAPEGAAELHEPARGRTPDYRRVPTRPYRSNPGSFPAADPAARTGPLLVPLLSARRRRPPFRRTPLPPWDGPFNRLRLASELFRRPPIVALAIRSHQGLSPDWDGIEQNLELLSRHHNLAFMTASAAARRYLSLSAELGN